MNIEHYPSFQLLICILLSLVPTIIWGYIFIKKRKKKSPRLIILTFLASTLSIFPLLLYKLSWEYFPNLNAFALANIFENKFISIADILIIPVSVIVAFMIVGLIEEQTKHYVVKHVDQNRFQSIDDAIMYSIIAALGFSFSENILYFSTIWDTQGLQNLYISFVFRSIFSTFAHILFSGIYGYFYGIAYFAKPIFREEIRQKKRYPVIKFLHNIFHIKSSELFSHHKMFQGLIIAILLHAVFNIFLELNMIFITVPYLIFGYSMLVYLLKKKKNHKKYERLLVAERVDD